jgi:hypothetical protein
MATQKAKYGLLAQAKRQKGKTSVLGFLALMMMVVWSRNLTGADDDQANSAPKPSPNAHLNLASAPGSPNAPAAKASLASLTGAAEINSYNIALTRLEAWRQPLGLEKVAPLTPELIAERKEAARLAAVARTERATQARLARLKAEANGEAGLDLSAAALLNQEDEPVNGGDDLDSLANEALVSGPGNPVNGPPATIDQTKEINFELTGTALLGKNRYAIFGTHTVQEGQRIGRYIVQAVRPREVDLLAEGSLTVVRIAPPDLQISPN